MHSMAGRGYRQVVNNNVSEAETSCFGCPRSETTGGCPGELFPFLNPSHPSCGPWGVSPLTVCGMPWSTFTRGSALAPTNASINLNSFFGGLISTDLSCLWSLFWVHSLRRGVLPMTTGGIRICWNSQFLGSEQIWSYAETTQ